MVSVFCVYFIKLVHLLNWYTIVTPEHNIFLL